MDLENRPVCPAIAAESARICEGRAALYRCYSAVWFDLLSHLELKYNLSRESVLYHRLMHFDVVLPSDDGNADFHLFHGHIFALHPGLGLFFQTKTGGELISDFLSDESGTLPFHRLLNGFWISLFDYNSRSERYAASRKKGDVTTHDGDIEEMYAAQLSQQKYRRRRGPKRC